MVLLNFLFLIVNLPGGKNPENRLIFPAELRLLIDQGLGLLRSLFPLVNKDVIAEGSGWLCNEAKMLLHCLISLGAYWTLRKET